MYGLERLLLGNRLGETPIAQGGPLPIDDRVGAIEWGFEPRVRRDGIGAARQRFRVIPISSENILQVADFKAVYG